MEILAEIADKMPTVAEVWVLFGGLGLVLGGVTFFRRSAAFVTIPVAAVIGAFSAYVTYHEAYLEDPFRDAVWRELGATWVVSCFASAAVPFVAVVSVAVLSRGKAENDG